MEVETKGVLFDHDGTVAKSINVWYKAIESAMHILNLDGNRPSQIDVGRKILPRLESIMEYGDVSPDQYLEFRSAVLARAIAYLEHVNLHDRVLETLELLKDQGLLLAIVTSAPEEVVHKQLKRHGVFGLFDTIIAREHVKFTKPHPEPIERAVANLGVELDLAVMIGDTQADIAAANQAGVSSVLFNPNENQLVYQFSEEEIDQMNPDHVIYQFSEIPSIL